MARDGGEGRAHFRKLLIIHTRTNGEPVASDSVLHLSWLGALGSMLLAGCSWLYAPGWARCLLSFTDSFLRISCLVSFWQFFCPRVLLGCYGPPVRSSSFWVGL